MSPTETKRTKVRTRPTTRGRSGKRSAPCSSERQEFEPSTQGAIRKTKSRENSSKSGLGMKTAVVEWIGQAVYARLVRRRRRTRRPPTRARPHRLAHAARRRRPATHPWRKPTGHAGHVNTSRVVRAAIRRGPSSADDDDKHTQLAEECASGLRLVMCLSATICCFKKISDAALVLE